MACAGKTVVGLPVGHQPRHGKIFETARAGEACHEAAAIGHQGCGVGDFLTSAEIDRSFAVDIEFGIKTAIRQVLCDYKLVERVDHGAACDENTSVRALLHSKPLVVAGQKMQELAAVLAKGRVEKFRLGKEGGKRVKCHDEHGEQAGLHNRKFLD